MTLSFHRHTFNFDACAFRQRLHRHGGASGEGSGEEIGIDFVHAGKIVHVGEENGGFDDVSHAESDAFKNVLNVEERLAGEVANVALGELSGGGVNGKLPGDIDRVAGLDGLAVRTDGSGCQGGLNGVFYILLKL